VARASTSWRARARLVVLLAFAVAGGVAAAASIRRDLATPTDLAAVGYVRSESCRRCHDDHYRTWSRTFHRTMTQEAGPESVLGDFDDATYLYDGVRSRFTREGNAFFIETLGPEGRLERYRVARTIGSRRIQQYAAKIGDRYIRLPVGWNVEERRWFHLNGAFLDPDGTPFDAHTAVWDANCIFCHNTKAKPGYDLEQQTFASDVEQLGIACEACHGPGEEHAARNASPLRRYALHLSDRDDPTIVDPKRLSAERQVMICGHCHGQRVPSPRERVRQFLTLGDPYTPGEALSDYTEPIHRDTKLEGVDISLRFWRDGTPRLTAYEYQGLLMTRDYREGGLTCISCHEMHGGDPRGMIAEPMRGAAACASCHAGIVRDPASHAKHGARTSADCYACHMPKIVYGILDVHPSHRISRPDPSRAWRDAMPDACALCHTSETAAWAAGEAARLYGMEARGAPNDGEWAMAENARALFGGDVVQRAVAAAAFADERAPGGAIERLWAIPLLAGALEDDYPAIRHFAHRSIRTLVARAGALDARFAVSALPAFDPLAPPEARAEAVAAHRAWWSALDKRGIGRPGAAVPLDAALELDRARVAPLVASRASERVSIGE
jgi:predicted CXXCH cytochrome family protein